MSDAFDIRRLLNLLEGPDAEYQNPRASDTIRYQADSKGGQFTKVTAFLTSYDSGRYTRLGRNLNRIQRLEDKIKTLKEHTKQESRELVADLFNAEDAACTRVVDTVGFLFQMSKDPKATETVKYAKVLEELQNRLTPDLQSVLEELIAKHTSAPVQKAASLKATDKAAQADESINEGIGDKLKSFLSRLASWVDQWGARYDAQLDALRSELGLHEDIAEEDEFKGQDIYALATQTSREMDQLKLGSPEWNQLAKKMNLINREIARYNGQDVSRVKQHDIQEDDEVAQTPVKPNPRTSSEARFTEADLRAAHKDGWNRGRQTSPSYTGGYKASMWDLSKTRAALGLGPKGQR